MFKIEITTLDPRVLFAFGKLFNDLAGQSATGNLTEMTGSEYLTTISKADLPDTGNPLSGNATIRSDVPHTVGVHHTAHGLTDAASVFGPKLQPAPSIAVVGQPLTVHEATQDTSTKTTADLTPAQVFGSPAQIVAAPTPDISPVLLDKDGLPWDMRIHASTRTQTQQGLWKAKRGVDDATVAAVTAELRQALAATRAPFVPLNAPSPPSTVVPVVPPPIAPSPGATPAPAIDFLGVCQLVASMGIKTDRVLEVCNRHGIAGLGLLNVCPDLAPAIAADFKSGL